MSGDGHPLWVPLQGPFSGPPFPALLSLALLQHSGTGLTPPSHFLLQD